MIFHINMNMLQKLTRRAIKVTKFLLSSRRKISYISNYPRLFINCDFRLKRVMQRQSKLFFVQRFRHHADVKIKYMLVTLF